MTRPILVECLPRLAPLTYDGRLPAGQYQAVTKLLANCRTLPPITQPHQPSPERRFLRKLLRLLDEAEQ